jgi:hypothetical protein
MGKAWHFRRRLASVGQFAFWCSNGSVFACQNGRKSQWRPCHGGRSKGDGGGPKSPDVSKPDTRDLLKKMRKVDPNQSKRYRQRTGQ